MYKRNCQLSIEDFVFPFGKLNSENKWVKLAEVAPWDKIDDVYAKNFVPNGAPAYPARMALGSLIVKQMLWCSDVELCEHIAENPYIQYFIGLKEFTEGCPFGASTLVAFRRRFTEDDLKSINEMIIKNAKGNGKGNGKSNGGNGSTDGNNSDGDNNKTDGNDSGNNNTEHTLALDATVAPSDITYPQDVKLLNCAREHLERIIDDICRGTGLKKPRTYRNCARRDYLNFSKSKKRTIKKTRYAIRRGLAYIKRDLGYIDALTNNVDYPANLDDRTLFLIKTIRTLFEQQTYMYERRTHSVQNRIVSISQPWVRPIVRGKAKARTEFGAKLHLSVDDKGLARIETISFDPFNEADYLIESVKNYHKRKGIYPDRLLVDKIYRNHKNLAFCKEKNIQVSGPRLGRPPKDHIKTVERKKQERKDAARRNCIEGVFGTAKTTYGLDPVAARLEETTKTVIALSILTFNLKKLLKVSFGHFWDSLFSVLSGLRVDIYDYDCVGGLYGLRVAE